MNPNEPQDEQTTENPTAETPDPEGAESVADEAASGRDFEGGESEEGLNEDSRPGEEEEDDDEEEEEESEDEDEENEDPDTIHIRVRKVGGINPTIIGKVSQGREDEPVVAKLGPKTLTRLRGVFAKPDGYEQFIKTKDADKNRIIAIHGPKRSGKLTCAVNLACDLWGEDDQPPRIYRYKRGPDETRSLGAAIQSKRVKKGTVLILEDVFEGNVPRRELEPPELSDLEEALEGKECFLLVTTRTEDAGAFQFAQVNARVRDLKRVLEAHLRYLRGQENWALGDELVAGLLAKWPALKKNLHNPAQIERFCRRLAEQPPRNAEEIERLAEQAAVAGRRALQEWFGGLRSNEKLLAMLVYLFSGSERQFLEEIYRRSVRGLRAEGLVWLEDPRQIGFDDMLEAVEVQDLGGLIEFKDPEFEEEVAAQVENWSHLIWSILNPLVKDVRPGEDWDTWQPRRGLGNALGRVSFHDQKSFAAAVGHLAGQGWEKAAVVAGYALEEAVRRDFTMHSRPVTEALRSWIDSGKPTLMWAAGASLGRVFAATLGKDANEGTVSAFQGKLIHLLQRMVVRSESFSEESRAEIERQGDGEVLNRTLRKWGFSNRKCAWRTASRIVSLDSSRAPLLGLWLQDEKEFLRKVAREAIKLIFEGLTEPHYKPGDARHRPFLDLVEPVLAATGKDKHGQLLVEQVFLALKSWLRWESWHSPIFQTLLDIANRGSSEVRAKLRSALSSLWLHRGSNQESQRAFAIAQAVIARAYAMDGILMDRPRFGRCIFVLDPAFLRGDAESRDRKEKIYQHLLSLLEAQVDVSVIHLGSRRCGQNGLPQAVDHPLPPLVMPALEAAWTADTRLILVLTARRIWDLEDAASQTWAQNFFVVASGDSAGEHEGIEVIPIGEDAKPEEVAKIEKALQSQWARALSKAGPAEWLGVLQSFGVGGEIEEGPRAWLNRLVAGLADLGGATGHGDLARKILCLAGWYASRDLRACAGLFRSWLEEPMEDEGSPCRRWMGSAGARTLFSIHSAETPSPEDSAPEILFEELAAPLAAQGRDGSEAVLRAVRKWIEEPVWAWYLAGDVVEGQGRLLRWAERFAPQHAGELRRLLPELKETPAPSQSGLESLAAMIERLHVRAAIGAPKTLPELAEGERYAVIAIDASDLDTRKAANLDTVTNDLLRSLKERNGHGLKPVIYRLGERRPVWVAGVPAPRETLLAPEAPRQPRLLGPILMEPGLSPERVKFVLVLSVQPLLDAEDWLETEWRDRVIFYRSGAGSASHPGFATLPALGGSSTGASIARFLLSSAA